MTDFRAREFEFINRGMYGDFPELYTGSELYSTFRVHGYVKTLEGEEKRKYVESWKKDNKFDDSMRKESEENDAGKVNRPNCTIM